MELARVFAERSVAQRLGGIMHTRPRKRGRYGYEGAIDDKPAPKRATVLPKRRGVAVVITEPDSKT
jgi:hypothetical protein